MYCLFCDLLSIVCVYMCTEQLPPGGYPIAVKYKYNNNNNNNNNNISGLASLHGRRHAAWDIPDGIRTVPDALSLPRQIE